MTRPIHFNQGVEDCRWSVPACRLNPISDRDEFQTYWTCERTAVPVPVTRAECDTCSHFLPWGRTDPKSPGSRR